MARTRRKGLDDEAPLLRDPVDVGLTAPAVPTHSSATGSRKRARETVEGEDEQSRAEAAVLECEKAMRRADATVVAAEAKEESKFHSRCV